MKAYLFRRALAVALLSPVVLMMFQAFTPVASAQSPIKEEIWDGKVWAPKPFFSKTFEAPPDAARVEVEAKWGWSGSPGQKQHNEEHEVRLPNGQVIQCHDYGNEELDKDNDGLVDEDEWIYCGSTAFEWGDPLKIEVV
ncbi:MAG TPA: hypothetical protein VEC93_12770, partial [Anaerolineae bacterium]|nr:hypothetical protein [Anaerolineae bacterium]